MHEAIDRASDMARTWVTLVQLISDSHSVMALRIMGLSGAWSLPEGENSQMIQEKLPAFTEAAVAGALTAMSGRGPDRVMQALIAPISEKANANRLRLTGREPAANDIQ
jgi:hypothetical protein